MYTLSRAIETYTNFPEGKRTENGTFALQRFLSPEVTRTWAASTPPDIPSLFRLCLPLPDLEASQNSFSWWWLSVSPHTIVGKREEGREEEAKWGLSESWHAILIFLFSLSVCWGMNVAKRWLLIAYFWSLACHGHLMGSIEKRLFVATKCEAWQCVFLSFPTKKVANVCCLLEFRMKMVFFLYPIVWETP